MVQKKNSAPGKRKRDRCKQNQASKSVVPPLWAKTLGRNALMYLATFRLFLWRHKTLYETAWALFLGAPPFLVVNYLSIDRVAASLSDNWPVLAAALDAEPIKWFALALLWAWLCEKIRRTVASQLTDTPSGWENAAPILLNLLGSVVGSKEQRFQAALIAADQKNGPIDSGEVFSQITQPELQMREIMQNVYLAFDNLLRKPGQPRKKLKVNLAVIKDGAVVSIKYHYPNDCPVLSVDALNNPRSAIKSAVKKKRIEVVESILDAGENPQGNFILTDQARPDEDGSLICYPVTFKPISDVVFVISVCYLERGTFRNRFANSYTEILEPFALRLRVEFCLLGLKEMIGK